MIDIIIGFIHPICNTILEKGPICDSILLSQRHKHNFSFWIRVLDDGGFTFTLQECYFGNRTFSSDTKSCGNLRFPNKTYLYKYREYKKSFVNYIF